MRCFAFRMARLGMKGVSSGSHELEAFGMADVIFLAIGGGAFLAFAALAAALKRL